MHPTDEKTDGSPITTQDSSTLFGLDEAAALSQYRKGFCNRLPRSRETGTWSIVRRNVFTLFNLLNLVLAALLFWVGSYRNMLFLGVVISNTLIGLTQELRAKRLHDKLQVLSQGKVRVRRGGIEYELPPDHLVLGDVVILGRGDQVPADAKLLTGACLVSEALLTGENTPIAKQSGDTLLSGSYLTEGSVFAGLTAVGASSYAGKLQMSARKVSSPRSELMESMQKIIRRVSVAIVPLGLLLYFKQTHFLQMSQHDSVTKTVAAVLGMIPEGLMLLTSLALTVGVLHLGKRKALVNQLYGIESLARTDVVCMDKTGTLTTGAMRLKESVLLSDFSSQRLHDCMTALLKAQAARGPTYEALVLAFDRESAPSPHAIVPFSSERKWSGAEFADPDLKTLVMGAPERLLTDFPETLAKAQAFSAHGYRVLALLQSDAPLREKALPLDSQPVALLILQDELRPEVRETLRYFQDQGVTLKVISGDSPLTVQAVAGDAGLPMAEMAIDLSSLEAPINYAALCETYAIFGRVSPEDKRGLIEALKENGHGVAMIGDGVNDIPALKAADCSIAMACGSDAACRVAQITLLNEDFSVMPQILLEGRRVINNITRASSLFLVKNIYSILLSMVLLFLPWAYPFSPIQLSLVASLTIGIPSFVLAFQPSRERVRGQFLRNVFLGALPGGVTVSLMVLALYIFQRPFHMDSAVLSTLCACAAAYSGLCVLLITCRPLNLLRGLLVFLMTTAVCVAMLLFPSVFYFVPIQGSHLFVLGGLLLFTPLCLLLMRAIIGWLWPTQKPAPGSAQATRGPTSV